MAHYANSVVVPDVENGDILEIFAAGMANTTSPLSLLIVSYIENTGAKSNDDTAYSWRGNYVIYIWAFFTRTAGVPCVLDSHAPACRMKAWSLLHGPHIFSFIMSLQLGLLCMLSMQQPADYAPGADSSGAVVRALLSAGRQLAEQLNTCHAS